MLAVLLLPLAGQVREYRDIFQRGSWDASTSRMTKPHRWVATLPATCASGETFTLMTTWQTYSCVFGVPQRLVTSSTPARTIQADVGLVVVNGDGVAGNPSIGLDQTVVPLFFSDVIDPAGSCSTGQVFHRTDTAETWACPNGSWVKLVAATLSSSAVLSGWGAIAPGGCVRKTLPLPGVVGSDTLSEGWPAAVPDSLYLKMRPGVDLVVVEVCNFTGAGIAVPDGMTFAVKVLR